MRICGNISINSSYYEKVFQSSVEKIKTHIFCSISFPDNRVVYEIMWRNMVQSHSPKMTI